MANPLIPPVAVTRWLTSLSLVQSAESLVRHDADVSAAVALITADAATEAILGLLGTRASEPLPAKVSREGLIARATDVMTAAGHPIDGGLLADLRSTHAQRNDVVHHGSRAGTSDALRAIAVARGLLGLVPAVAVPALPAEGGLASGVAEVLGLRDVAVQLRLADEALSAEDAEAAATAAGLALGRLRRFVNPVLGETIKGYRSIKFRPEHNDRVGRDLADDLRDIHGRVDRLEPWLAASAFGLSPFDLARLEAIVGYYVAYATSPLRRDQIMSRETVPSWGDARWAVESVAGIAFRLWEMGSLPPRETRVFIAANEPDYAEIMKPARPSSGRP